MHDWEAVSTIVGLLVLALQAFNLYITTGIKYWAVRTFVTKEDLPNLVTGIQRKDHVQHIRPVHSA